MGRTARDERTGSQGGRTLEIRISAEKPHEGAVDSERCTLTVIGFLC